MTVELARGHYLRENGLGGYMISSSAVTSWDRCQLQRFYELRARSDAGAPQPTNLSATVYGSIMHYVLQAMELAMHEGHDDPKAMALAMWAHYWDPRHMTEIPGIEAIDEWIGKDTFGGLQERGRMTIRLHYDVLVQDKSTVLALEYAFAVPMEIDGRIHTIMGQVDRLTLRSHYNIPYVGLDDNKTGKQPTYLRYHMQGTVYGYASTREEFWRGWPESGLGPLETFPEDVLEKMETMFASHGYRLHDGQPGDQDLASRRFRWVNLKEIKFADGGWRVQQDYDRLKLAVDAYVRASEAGIYGVNTVGEICRYCAFKDSCAGVGLPDSSEGAPTRKKVT